MTTDQITADVDRGLAVVAEIEALRDELRAIESRLQQAALASPTVPLENEEREGRQFLARGSTATLPVVIESDQVIASFPADGPIHSTLCRLCGGGDRLAPIFRLVAKFERVPKDGHAYRLALREHFDPLLAPEILAATLQRDKNGVPRSRVYAAWDRAR